MSIKGVRIKTTYNNKIGSLERTVEKKLILFSTMERKGSKLKHQILYGAGMVRMTFIQTKIGSIIFVTVSFN